MAAPFLAAAAQNPGFVDAVARKADSTEKRVMTILIVIVGAIALGGIIKMIIDAVRIKKADGDQLSGTGLTSAELAAAIRNGQVAVTPQGQPVGTNLQRDVIEAKQEANIADCSACQSGQPDFFQFLKPATHWAAHTAKCGPIRPQCQKVGFNYKLWSELPGMQ